MSKPTTEIQYRLQHFLTPQHSPFTPGPTQWPTIVAEFIRPVVQKEEGLLYWFCNHGDTFQLAFASDDYVRIQGEIRKRQEMMVIADAPKNAIEGDTVAGAFGGTRWFRSEKFDKAEEAKRGELSLRFLHAACELYMHMLVQDGVPWRREVNKDENNPLGSAFESLFHLVSNLSQTEVEVEVLVKTQLMTARSAGKGGVWL